MGYLLTRRREMILAEGGKEPLTPYANDILTLDGILNTRAGHNSSSTVWEDLSGKKRDFVRGSGTIVWENNCLSVLKTGAYLQNVGGIALGDSALSVELVWGAAGDGGSWVGMDGSTYFGTIFKNGTTSGNQHANLCLYQRSKDAISPYYNNKLMARATIGTNKTGYFCMVIDSSGTSVYLNGSLLGTDSNYPYSQSAFVSAWYVGAGYKPNGRVYRVGLSSTALTSAEIAERYQYYKDRFGF